MTTFDKREENFEKEFARDQDLRFKATARRNKLLGRWAADKLGLSEAAADDYAKEVVLAQLDGSNDEAIIGKIQRDFSAKNVAQSDHQIRRNMEELMEKAIAEVKAQG